MAAKNDYQTYTYSQAFQSFNSLTTNIVQTGYRYWLWTKVNNLTTFTLQLDDYSGSGNPETIYYIACGC